MRDKDENWNAAPLNQFLTWIRSYIYHVKGILLSWAKLFVCGMTAYNYGEKRVYEVVKQFVKNFR